MDTLCMHVRGTAVSSRFPHSTYDARRGARHRYAAAPVDPYADLGIEIDGACEGCLAARAAQLGHPGCVVSEELLAALDAGTLRGPVLDGPCWRAWIDEEAALVAAQREALAADHKHYAATERARAEGRDPMHDEATMKAAAEMKRAEDRLHDAAAAVRYTESERGRQHRNIPEEWLEASPETGCFPHDA